MTKSQAKKMDRKLREQQIANDKISRDKAAAASEARSLDAAFALAPDPVIEPLIKKAVIEGVGEIEVKLFSVKFDGQEVVKSSYQEAFKYAQTARKEWRQKHGDVLTLSRFRNKIAAEHKRLVELMEIAGLPAELSDCLKIAEEALTAALTQLPAPTVKKEVQAETEEQSDQEEIVEYDEDMTDATDSDEILDEAVSQ